MIGLTFAYCTISVFVLCMSLPEVEKFLEAMVHVGSLEGYVFITINLRNTFSQAAYTNHHFTGKTDSLIAACARVSE